MPLTFEQAELELQRIVDSSEYAHQPCTLERSGDRDHKGQRRTTYWFRLHGHPLGFWDARTLKELVGIVRWELIETGVGVA